MNENRQVLIENLIEIVSKKLHISEAEIGRRLGVDRQRLYHWKTLRRKMPTAALYKLATMAGNNITNTLGQYQMEWHSNRYRQGKESHYLDKAKERLVGAGVGE